MIFEGEWMNPTMFVDVGVISLVSLIIVVSGILVFEKYGSE